MSRFIFIIAMIMSVAGEAQVILFPGDANNDGVANQFDILPVGVAYGTEGFIRPGASLEWQPQFHPTPWLNFLPVSNINLAFVDCDGNGIIDSLDIDAIAFNYDSMQNMAQPPPQPYLLPDTCFSCPKPDLLITFDRDTAMIKDTFYAFLTLRYPPNVPPVLGALGIAFDLTYDPVNVKDALTKVFPDTMPGDLMFISATTSLAKAWRSIPPGNVGFGAAGKGKNVLSLPRQLGAVELVVEDLIIRSMPVAADFWMDPSNILIINEHEQVVCLGNVEVDTIVLFDPANAVVEPGWQESVTLSPNPAKDRVDIYSPETLLQKVEVYDGQGRLVRRAEFSPAHQFRLDLTPVISGLYFIKITTAKGWAVRKLPVTNHP